MNPRNHYPDNAQQRQLYPFGRQGWPMGESPSFEEDLTASDGNDEQNVQKFTELVRDLQAETMRGLEDIRTDSPKLYRHITQVDPARLLPNNGSGMSAASIFYVTHHLATRMHPPDNQQEPQGFLRYVTQICITIWVYQCDQADWRELKRSVSDFILRNGFQPSMNDAAYLIIIAFVLGGELDQMLEEYVDAVVWDSKLEFACEIEPLRNAISRERRALVEFMHNSFSHVLNGLAYSGDKQLWSLGQRLHARLMSAEFRLDLSRTFAGTQDFNSAQYPAAFESTFLETLKTEREALGLRGHARAASDAEIQHWNPPAIRHGNGGPLVAAIGRVFRGNGQQSAQTRLETILKEATRGIEEKRRRRIADAVQKLKRERNGRLQAASVAADESACHRANGTAGR
ncbi:uncharacterized protein A1O5_03548 [Cladophialophora psammophila CBS 110553]|uniref:Uncharacterized protein n=1 Tax=Cladophialophora psammophila CBS 110553 TaxID=1182543 RepID=W9XA28_9EURO|nr:uncharacterized protein A1O5_03548 [Cladophialophora psammophila CBS 110553]EXJ73786.1 hypothetical protein A1O5_03548 [Cladophialophora psammophila CBS 110553]